MAKKKSRPQPPEHRAMIRVVGQCSITHRPDRAELTVHIEVSSPTRKDAWAEYQARIATLIELAGDESMVRSRQPHETTDEVKKNFRDVELTTLTGSPVITLDTADFAELLTALVERDFMFDAPKFSFTKPEGVSTEQLEEAAANAHERAAAVAIGLGVQLGDVIDVEITDPSAPSNFELPYFDFDQVHRSIAAPGTPNIKLTVDDIPTRSANVRVHVTYQLRNAA